MDLLMTARASISIPAPPGFLAEVYPVGDGKAGRADGYRVRVRHEGDPWQEIPSPQIRAYFTEAQVREAAEKVVAEHLEETRGKR